MDIGIVIVNEGLKCDSQSGQRYRISERGFAMRSAKLIVGIVIQIGNEVLKCDPQNGDRYIVIGNEGLKCDPQNGHRYRNWERGFGMRSAKWTLISYFETRV